MTGRGRTGHHATAKYSCENCGTVVERYPSSQRRSTRGAFCKPQCFYDFRNKQGLVGRTCEQCGKSFTVKRCTLPKGRGRFCERACWRADIASGKKRVKLKCVACGVDFELRKSAVGPDRGKYCSLACSKRRGVTYLLGGVPLSVNEISQVIGSNPSNTGHNLRKYAKPGEELPIGLMLSLAVTHVLTRRG
jgi:hypothetical protein